MNLLKFGANSTMSAEERHFAIGKFLKDNALVVVNFTKIDGSERSMPCTLNSAHMPELAVNEHHKTRIFNPETMSVWCTDKQAWRSFKTMNVTSVESNDITTKSYTAQITDSEDGTGDAVLTFDPKMLESLGWLEGDTLSWKYNDDGSVVLSKVNVSIEP